MTALVHTADTQLKNWPFGGVNPQTGLNRRFEDALMCFDFVIDQAIEKKVKFFIHAGDVNEERNPEAIAQDEFSKRIKRLRDAGIIVIIVVGNHDIDSAIGTTTSVSYLKSLGIEGVYVIDRRIETLTFFDEGIRFLGVPYFTKAQLNLSSNEEVVEKVTKAVKAFLEAPEADDFYNVIVPHYSVDKVFEGLEINEPILPISIFEDVDYLALGHIHKYEMYYDHGVTGGYCGSPYKVNFGENHDKFFNFVDFDKGEVEKIKIPNRDFVDLLIDARDSDQAGIDVFVLHKLAKIDLENKFLKITIQCYQNFNPKTIYDHLKKRNLFHYLPIQFEKERVKQESRLDYDPGLTSEEIVKAYLKKQDLPEDFKEEVLRETRDIITKVGF